MDQTLHGILEGVFHLESMRIALGNAVAHYLMFFYHPGDRLLTTCFLIVLHHLQDHLVIDPRMPWLAHADAWFAGC